MNGGNSAVKQNRDPSRRKRAASKSQSNLKTDGAKPSESQGSMLPSFMKWDGLGQPWQKGSPEGRLAKVSSFHHLQCFRASRRAAGGGSRGQSSHRKLAEEHGGGFHAQVYQDIITAARAKAKTPRLQGKGTPQEPPTKILSHSSPRPRPLFSRLSACSRL